MPNHSTWCSYTFDMFANNNNNNNSTSESIPQRWGYVCMLCGASSAFYPGKYNVALTFSHVIICNLNINLTTSENSRHMIFGEGKRTRPHNKTHMPIHTRTSDINRWHREYDVWVCVCALAICDGLAVGWPWQTVMRRKYCTRAFRQIGRGKKAAVGVFD